MLKIDNSLLQEIGLGDLPMEEKDLLITQVYEQLEVRVGTRLAENMTDAQLEEFDSKYMQTQDQEGAIQWLQQNFPDYPKVVEEELYKLKDELKQQAPTIKQVVIDQASDQDAASDHSSSQPSESPDQAA